MIRDVQLSPFHRALGQVIGGHVHVDIRRRELAGAIEREVIAGELRNLTPSDARFVAELLTEMADKAEAEAHGYQHAPRVAT